MIKGMKILIAYDGSEPSKHALDQGVSLAKLTDSEVTILSVIPRITMPLLPAEGAGVSPASIAQTSPEFQQEMKKFYAESLEKAAEDLEEKYPNIRVLTELMEGRPSFKIVEIAEDGDYDLIVIGSRGLGGISGWILGSTSRRVVETCTVLVLVVK
jgi:nucleotide-binding universal stress UspA family protein